jgi:type IV secretory pathway component VirB8
VQAAAARSWQLAIMASLAMVTMMIIIIIMLPIKP